MLDRSRSRDRSKTGDPFSPVGLFVTGAQGAWYDPSDFSTLYQTSTGTTPVTAVEQPVGLMLDRSRGLVLGPELWGTPALSGSSWAWDGSTLTGLGVTTGTATGSAVVAGRSYRITLTVSATGSGLFQVRVGTTFIATLAGGANTTYTYIVAAASTTGLEFTSSGGTTGTITNISCRELPGTHALQATSASRPVLRARYNLLTRSEEFDDAYWAKIRSSISANAAVAPDGTTTADKLIENTDTDTHTLFPNIALTLATTTGYTYSIYAKAAERTIIHLSTNDLAGAFFDLSAGTVSDIASGFTASITSAGSGWYRCVLTQALNSNASGRLVVSLVSTGTTTSYTGDGTSGILIWGAQLLTAADEASTGGAYQRIAAATDYDVSNPVWRPYLAFDGVDDSFGTSSIDFSATDEMTVFAGLTKLSDAASAMLVELSANAVSNAGAFNIQAPVTGGNPEYRYLGGGSTFRSVLDSAAAAPRTDVLTATQDISGDAMELRRNGVSVGTSALDQGTGNFGNYPLFIGARNNASTRFNGRLTSLIVLGRTATAAEISATEAWVNGKTGAY